MEKQLQGILTYPRDEQANPLFSALSSVLLPALGYTEETPFFCAPKNRFCTRCGECGNKSIMHHHHLSLYHQYQTFTGVGLGWAWPEQDSPYQVLPGWAEGWRWPDAFWGFIFGYAALAWRRQRRGAAREDVLGQVRASIDAGMPALLRLGMDWHVVTGYGEGGALTGIGYHRDEEALPDWFDAFEDAVTITGPAPQSVTHGDLLRRMVQALEHPAHARLEADVMACLQGVTAENARASAEWLLDKASFPIEARWHAAEATDIFRLERPALWAKAFAVLRQYIFDDELAATHGTCWKIWGLLGVGPSTGYKLAPDAAERLLNAQTRAELARLFAIVFENDRVVLGLLREAAAMYAY